jgi:5-formyltetrahydrofolate cyclo-ligase
VIIEGMSAVDGAKQAIREQVWRRLEAAGAVAPSVAGRIPNFEGAGRAAQLLAALAVWGEAHVIKAVPDHAQQPVRQRALEDGKLVYMASPKLAAAKPFYVLDPQKLSIQAADAAERAVAVKIAPAVDLSEMQPVDLIVVGSVAVNHLGARLGKGAGYSDIEAGLLAEAGLISERTTIATTVHALQVLEEDIPEMDHDFRVDLIVTPEQVIWCRHPKRPAGLDWNRLRPEQIAAIPVLARRAAG